MHELRLQDRFYHPHWLAFLMSGLSQIKVSVVSGKAAQIAPQEWDVTLQLDFRGSVTVPERVDFRALTEKTAVLDANSIQLNSYLITRRFDKAIEVHIQGLDQLGFLGRFLTKVSLLALYPIEVKIGTVGGRISDQIVLNGLGNSPPSEEQQAALDSMLRMMKA